MHRTFFKLLFFLAVFVISLLALAPVEETPISIGWDKLNHVAAFFCLLALFEQAFAHKPSLVSKVFILFVYGLLIEAVQQFIPLRELSLLDVVANSCGLVGYLLVRPWLQRLLPASY